MARVSHDGETYPTAQANGALTRCAASVLAGCCSLATGTGQTPMHRRPLRTTRLPPKKSQRRNAMQLAALVAEADDLLDGAEPVQGAVTVQTETSTVAPIQGNARPQGNTQRYTAVIRGGRAKRFSPVAGELVLG